MPPYSGLFDLRVHHGGKIDFAHDNYNGGSVDYIREVDEDLYSMLDLKDDINVFGVENIESCSFYYKSPVSLKLRKFVNDMDMLAMFNLFRGVSDVVMVYVEHAVSSEGGVDGGTDKVVDNEGDGDGNNDENNRQGLGEDVGATTEDGGDSGSDSDSEASSAADFEYFAQGDALCDKLVNVDVKVAEDLNDEDSYDGINEKEDKIVNGEDSDGESIHTDDFKEVDSDGESLHSPNNSGDDEPTEKYPKFDRSRNMNNVELKLGMIFVNAAEFRAALREHSIQQERVDPLQVVREDGQVIGQDSEDVVGDVLMIEPDYGDGVVVDDMPLGDGDVTQAEVNNVDVNVNEGVSNVDVNVNEGVCSEGVCEGLNGGDENNVDEGVHVNVNNLDMDEGVDEDVNEGVDEDVDEDEDVELGTNCGLNTSGPDPPELHEGLERGHEDDDIFGMPESGDNMNWGRTSFDDILPPTVLRVPGRPKKLRRKAIGEPRNRPRKNDFIVRRNPQKLSCSNCKQTGHNVRRCTTTTNHGIRSSAVEALQNAWINPGGSERGRGAGRGSSVGVGVDSGAVVDSGVGVDIGVSASGLSIDEGVGASGPGINGGVSASGPGINRGVGASGPDIDRSVRTSTGTELTLSPSIALNRSLIAAQAFQRTLRHVRGTSVGNIATGNGKARGRLATRGKGIARGRGTLAIERFNASISTAGGRGAGVESVGAATSTARGRGSNARGRGVAATSIARGRGSTGPTHVMNRRSTRLCVVVGESGSAWSYGLGQASKVVISDDTVVPCPAKGEARSKRENEEAAATSRGGKKKSYVPTINLIDEADDKEKEEECAEEDVPSSYEEDDPRVMYSEPAKFVAKLRDMKTDDNVLLFKCELGAGHFSKSGRFEKLQEDAFTYAFIMKALNMVPAMGSDEEFEKLQEDAFSYAFILKALNMYMEGKRRCNSIQDIQQAYQILEKPTKITPRQAHTTFMDDEIYGAANIMP
ncbi:hypothetical protein RJ639_019410 [Escallonia herrerae]|uniref:Prolyl endopeptidase-like n=1 Tax=Escallonia herrerae TaxID=1293975 RepID=A0AA88V9S1_9ASTE|nr:hypothetical protein RJ639_019410 [Escallonia herrerae]